jgi:dCMP deaminase
MTPGDEEHLDTCPAASPCTKAVHAEANGIAYAARKGVSLEGSELHVTISPCLACAMLIVNAGVVRVVFEHDYRDTSGMELLVKAGIRIYT